MRTLCAVFLLFTHAFGADRAALANQLDAVASSLHGTLGYSIHHLRSGMRLARLGDEQFPSASTIKLAMLCAAFDKQQRGELKYDETLTMREEDRQYGTGVLHNYRAGAKVPLRTVLHLMITQSDNTAAVMLGQRLGQATVNAWLDAHALQKTRLLVPFPYQGSFDQAFNAGGAAWQSVRAWGMGVTTPNEMVALLEMILDGRACTPAACEEMQRILAHQFYDDGIASQVPPAVVVASKHGSEDQTRSDVAIVHTPSGDYVLAVYTKDAKDTGVKWDNEQDTSIRRISRLVWQAFEPRSRWSPAAGSEKLFLFQTEPCYPGMPCYTGARPPQD
jgi:beta-lactamase class A